jgi:hypothetical protein
MKYAESKGIAVWKYEEKRPDACDVQEENA